MGLTAIKGEKDSVGIEKKSMIFKNSFSKVTAEEKALLEEYFDGFDYEASSYTYIANYIWRDTHHITWEVIGEYLCIAGLGTLETEEEEYFMAMPLTKTGSYDVKLLRETMTEVEARFKACGQTLGMGLIPGHLMPVLEEAFGDKLAFERDRDDDDYIYLREDLAQLKGRKYHQKKNHLNFFLKNHSYTYEPITKEMVEDVLVFLEGANEDKLEDMAEDWQEILRLETLAMKQLLDFVEDERLLTGVVRIDGIIEAVTIGEWARSTNKETVLVHVEKANPSYRGLYQLINWEFCRRLPAETIYVNREEDMGLENLRQTKLSYRPFKLAEKYSAVVK